jgi:hypothetical protein
MPVPDPGIGLDPQTDGQLPERGAIGDEREIEGGPVPRGEHTRRKLGQALVQFPEDLVLGTLEQLVDGGGECDGDDAGHTGVESVDRGVRFDVEAVDG